LSRSTTTAAENRTNRSSEIEAMSGQLEEEAVAEAAAAGGKPGKEL
jgi:hypothetical protein